MSKPKRSRPFPIRAFRFLVHSPRHQKQVLILPAVTTEIDSTKRQLVGTVSGIARHTVLVHIESFNFFLTRDSQKIGHLEQSEDDRHYNQ